MVLRATTIQKRIDAGQKRVSAIRIRRKQLLSFVALVAALAIAWLQGVEIGGSPPDVVNASRSLPAETGEAVDRAFAARQSDVIVRGGGRVVRILADDNDGSPHQRFVVELKSGLTVLIAHNLDLAPRVEDLHIGDSLEFYGEYEWNDRGGVIHWTHRDPNGRRAGGWIKHAGRIFQ